MAKVVKVRLNAEEWESYSQMAETTGQPLAEVIRTLAAAGIEGSRPMNEQQPITPPDNFGNLGGRRRLKGQAKSDETAIQIIVQPGEPTDGLEIGRRLRAEGVQCRKFEKVVVMVEESPGKTRPVAWYLFRAGFSQSESCESREALQSAALGELGRSLG